MHLIYLANQIYLAQQQSHFHEMLTALAKHATAAGITVSCILPDSASWTDIEGVTTLRFEDTIWRKMQRNRILDLAEELAKRMPVPDSAIIHVMDWDLWQSGVALADHLNAHLVLSVWTPDDFQPLYKFGKQLTTSKRLQQLMQDTSPLVLAASGPLAQAVIPRLPESMSVEVVHQGVLLGEDRSDFWESRETERQASDMKGDSYTDPSPICVLVSGSGKLDEAYESLLDAIPKVLEHGRRFHFFFQGWESDHHSLWPKVTNLGLESVVTLLPRGLSHRDMLLGAHALIHPQALGRSRRMTLQAMGQAMPVIAAEDLMCDHLIEDKTAWLITQNHPDLWLDRLLRFWHEPQRVAKLAKSARAWVGKNRQLHHQIQSLADVYQRHGAAPTQIG